MTMRTVGRATVRQQRRARQWAITNATFTASTTPVAIDLQSQLEVDMDQNLHNVTAAAIRISLGCFFLTGSTVGERTWLYFGIIWMGNDAIVAGGASLPNPVNDSADWMMHGARLLTSEATVGNLPRGGQIDFFSDFMRKQRENNSSLILIGVTSSLNEHSVSVHVGGRVLFILP